MILLIALLLNHAEIDFHRLPGVVKVEVTPAVEATQQIVHLRDWHYVSKADFAAEIGDVDGLEKRYEQFLQDVERVQEEHLAVVRQLIEKHGLRVIYVEGLTDQDREVFELKVAALRGQPVRDQLQLGVAGRLLASGEIDAVVPLEDAVAYEAADPVRNGTIALNREKNQAREGAMVQRLLAGGPLVLVILGGAHDLSEGVQRLSGGKCEYVRLTTRRYRDGAGEN